MAKTRQSVCDLRIKDVMPYVAAFLLGLSLFGYLRGFIIVDLSARRHNLMLSDAAVVGQQPQLQQQQQPEFHVETFAGPSTRAAGDAADVIQRSYSSESQRLEKHELITERSAVSRSTPRQVGAQLPQRCSGPCSRRSDGRAITDGQWFDWSSTSFQLYAYSAIFDDRPSLNLSQSESSGLVRIIAVSSKLADDKEGTSDTQRLLGDLYCQLCYEDGSSVNVRVENEPKPIGYGWTVNGQLVREYVYTCPCPARRAKPTTVTLKRVEADRRSENETTCLPVQIPERQLKTRKMAVCAGVVHELPNEYFLIEWLELLKLMGVSSVSLYKMGDLNPEAPASKVMSFYSSAAADMFLELRKTSLLGASMDQRQHVLHSSPVINDCIYRNMYLFRYIMVIEINELIVPLNANHNVPQLLEYLEQISSNRLPTNYVFWNNYHFTDDKPDIAVSPYMTILRYRRQSPLSEYGHNIKSIINPLSCVNMHNQYCWSVTPGAAKNYMEIVDPKLAVKQTYSKCKMQFLDTQCSSLLANSTLDDSLMSFHSQLRKVMSERVLNILGHDI